MRPAAALILLMLLLPAVAQAVKIGDITRQGGSRTNVITGMGLVVGLKGTGDGGDYLPAIRPLAQMLGKFQNASTLAELSNADNVAIVSVTVKLPPNGVRNGDALDVYVMSVGAAKSLKGGRLFLTPMTMPVPDGSVMAFSQGAVDLEDPSTPTVGTVKKGCIMEQDVMMPLIEDGKFTLILEDSMASWTTANMIANVINGDDGRNQSAVVIDPKNILVTIPPEERARPDSFIARVQRLPVMMVPAEAKVQINERTGTMIITGDVEISPVVISHKGLTISTVRPEPVATPATPVVNTSEFVALDTMRTGGSKLNDLIAALDQLKVPVEDRIQIVMELHKTGKIHAKLEVE